MEKHKGGVSYKSLTLCLKYYVSLAWVHFQSFGGTGTVGQAESRLMKPTLLLLHYVRLNYELIKNHSEEWLACIN